MKNAIVLLIALIFFGCNQQRVRVYVTTGDKQKLFEEDATLAKDSEAAPDVLITLDTAFKLQQIDGFGAALTGSSAYLINKLESTQRDSLLNDLINPVTGIGISYLRLTMGASDFSLSDFTYNDMPDGNHDSELKNFSIDPDRAEVIPTLKEILAINPKVNIMSTPWTAPAWMKTNNSLRGGELKPEFYSTYASYISKYIKAYEAEGIKIHAITPQNEPLHHVANYPCMSMSATQQLDFVKNYLGPMFQSEKITTGIMLYDHNWDNTDYAISILNDYEAKKFVMGSAFHAYAGSVGAMSAVHNAHPDKGLYFTEISGGRWATNFSDNLMWNMENIFIGTMNNWSKNVLFWNLTLDQNDGPTNNGCSNCRGVVTLNDATGEVTKNEEYYALAHFTKFVRPGAYRIAVPAEETTQLFHVAFVNRDGSKVFVAANNNPTSLLLDIREGNHQYKITIPAKAVVTVVW